MAFFTDNDAGFRTAGTIAPHPDYAKHLAQREANSLVLGAIVFLALLGIAVGAGLWVYRRRTVIVGFIRRHVRRRASARAWLP